MNVKRLLKRLQTNKLETHSIEQVHSYNARDKGQNIVKPFVKCIFIFIWSRVVELELHTIFGSDNDKIIEIFDTADKYEQLPIL